MTPRLTSDQILALAPDPSSAKAGTALVNPRKWSGLGADEKAAWGECQGSGALPYQTRIDLEDTAFKCSCPSRKFPCKHGLGLYLLLAADARAFASSTAPTWVTEWLAARVQRAERKQQPEAPPDPQAQAKRAAAREAKVAAGLNDLERWLRDLVRMGIASLPGKEYSFWDAPAARLVDAQASGLARLVRELAGITASGTGWQDRFLEHLGLLTLLIQGYRRNGAMSEDVRADLRAAIGFTVSQDDVLASSGVIDQWLVVGRCLEPGDRLRVLRSWLLGKETGRMALVLSFSAGSEPFDTSLPTGSAFRGEVVFYPSAEPLRALVKSREPASMWTPAGVSLSHAHTQYRQALGRCPWIERFPMLISAAIPIPELSAFHLRDIEGWTLPMQATPHTSWKLVALAGGAPVELFGEWDGRALLPLTAWRDTGPVLLEGLA